MGSEHFYPEERPVHQRQGGRVLDGRDAGHRRSLPALRARDRLRHGRGAATRPGGVPGRRSRPARPWRSRLPEDSGSGESGRLPKLVGVRAGRELEAPRREGHDDQRARPASGRPRLLRGRGGVRRLGRQGAPDRGGVGVRRPRRARRRGFRLGRRALPGRQAAGEHVAGRVSVAEPEARRPRRHIAGRQRFHPTATASTT